MKVMNSSSLNERLKVVHHTAVNSPSLFAYLRDTLKRVVKILTVLYTKKSIVTIQVGCHSVKCW